MKILFYYHTSFDGTVLGMLYDEAKKFIEDKNNEVYFIMCDGFFSHCIVNPTGRKQVCQLCKTNKNKLFKNLFKDNEITLLNLFDYQESIDNIKFNYETSDELKQIEHDNIPIGYSTLSSYIQITRNQDPQINEISKTYFDSQLSQSINIIEAFKKLIHKLQPDLLCSYNGRFNEIRPVYETAKLNKVSTRLYEMVPEFDGTYNKVFFDNCMPHDILKNNWRIEYNWDNSKLSENDKNIKARNFFKRRRNGLTAGDKVYTKDQNIRLQPKDYDNSKINIVIFVSSEDEFVSLGGEYVDKSIFKSQIEGIEFILNQFKHRNEYHFYIRIHPNLAKVRYSYHTYLHSFEKRYNNATVVKANSKISTYKLIDSADKVIVFGSTVGLEAAYWGKPVILLTCCLYYYYNFVYKPKDKFGLIKLIEDDLESKYNDDVLKVGFYFYDKSSLYIESTDQFKYINYNPVTIKLFNKNIYGYKYQKLLKSTILAAFVNYTKRFLCTILSRKRFKLPVEDRYIIPPEN